MAKASRKKRKAMQVQPKKSSVGSLMQTIGHAISTSIQVAASGIAIYQALDDNTKAAITAALKSASIHFLRTVDTLPPDEQMVQTGKYIILQRKVVIWLGEIELPPMKNTFALPELASGIEQILDDGLKMPEEDLQKYLSTWFNYWSLSSSLPVADPERKKRRPLKL